MDANETVVRNASAARPRVKTVAWISLGCPKNLVYSEKMLGLLAADGLVPVSDEADADAVVISGPVEVDYPKAPLSSYLDLAEAIDDAPFDAVSLEDAHRHNDLDALLPRFARTSVVLGAVAIASSRVEPVEEIRARLATAARLAPAGVIAAPDCGLGYLSRELAEAKLTNLVAAARDLD